jgi:methylglutamate dehydrogenase subunit D
MPETSAQIGLERILPLKQHLRQGRYGALLDNGPGVRLSIRHPLSIVTIIASKDKGSSLSARLEAQYGIAAPNPRRMVKGNGLTLQWCGDQQYYALAEGKTEGALYAELKYVLEGLASLSDQSHGRAVMAVAGPAARAVLAKGSGVDFHRREFPVNSAVATQMAHIGVHVAATGEDAFELSLFRGFSEHFWEWLTEQSEEFGYEVI